MAQIGTTKDGRPIFGPAPWEWVQVSPCPSTVVPAGCTPFMLCAKGDVTIYGFRDERGVIHVQAIET